MRVHKPKVEYKLAPQEKPQGSILTYSFYKTNNLTRINWLKTRLIIASNKIRDEIPFKTKTVKYTAIWKKSIKTVKESKPSFFFFFFYTAHNVLPTVLFGLGGKTEDLVKVGVTPQNVIIAAKCNINAKCNKNRRKM